MKEKKPRTSKFFNSNLTTTLSISMVLFLVGLIAALSLTAKELSSYVKENIVFSVILFDETPDEDVQAIQANLQKAEYVKTFKFISKEQAIKELNEELGETPQDLLDYNPLLASIEVKVKANYVSSENLATIKQNLTRNPNVKEVVYEENQINLVNDNIQFISLFLLGFAALLLIISIGLINNTIRLQIYSKRFLINTMKLVGATSWFIRKPFLAKSVVNGVVASVIASGLLVGLLYYVNAYYLQMLNLLQPEYVVAVVGVIFVLGIIISFVSSLFAVGKYLRYKTNDLYYI